MLVSGSFLSKDLKPKDAINIFNKSDVDYIHVDVMDGKFVPEKTFTLGDIEKFSTFTTKPLDVHLMVNNPDKYIDSISMLNTKYITFHYESVNKPMDVIEHIKNNGIEVGISINPSTNVKDILELIPDVDLILVMSVEPGKSGQKFMESVLYKLDVLKKYISDNNYKCKISIDGGINDETYPLVKDKVDMVVSASYLLSGNTNLKVKEFKLGK